MLKLIMSIIAGVIVAFALVFAVDYIVHSISPTGPAPDPDDREAIRAYVAAQPEANLAMLVVGWGLAVLGGAALASRLGQREWAGWVVGGLFLFATAANFLLIPHPGWMVFGSIASIMAGGWLGSRLGARAGDHQPG